MTRQIKVKLEKVRGNNVNVSSEFKYVRYSNEETLKPESKIKKINSGFEDDSMYISLNVNINVKRNSAAGNVRVNINESLDQKLTRLANLEGNSKDFSLFNKLKKGEDFTLFIKDISREKDLSTIDSFLGIDIRDYSDFKDYIVSSKNIILNNTFKKDVILKNKTNPTFNESIENVITSYSDLYGRNLDLEKSQNIDSIFSNFLSFNKRSVYNEEHVAETSTTFIGLYIEKFAKVEDKYEKIAATYKKIQRPNNEALAIDNIDFEVKDGHVKYGKTYRYSIFPVYLIDIPTLEDFHTIDQFIVCNSPYITGDIICKDYVRPEPPQMIFFKYYKNKKQLKIEWQNSISEQGDVKGYQIFKRNSLDEPYKLVKQIEFHSKFDAYERNKNILSEEIFKSNEFTVSEFFDNDFDTSKINIYTICSIDAHGYVSNYSVQLGVIYDFIRGKCIIDTISKQGAPLNYPNLLIPRKTMFIDNDDKLVSITPKRKNFKKATLYITPEYETVTDLKGGSINILNDNYRLNILNLDNFKIISHDIAIIKE